MSKNCLLGVSFDELHWKTPNDTDITTSPGISLCDTVIPGATTGAEVRGSKYGGYFQATTEHRVNDAETAGDIPGRTEDFISYYCWAKYASANVTADGRQSFLTSHFDGDNAPAGAVRIFWNIIDVGETYTPSLESKGAGGWDAGFASATNPLDLDYDSQDCWALQVDLSPLPGANAKARIMHYDEGGACPNGAELGAGNGTWHEEITWTASANITAAGVKSNPSLGFWQISGKGTTHLSKNVSSYWVYEATAAADLPDHEDASSNEYETWASYCKADDTISDWTATGTACSGLWRGICDPEEPDATANSYISEVTGDQEIYLGEVADIGAANGNQMASLDGVGLTAIVDVAHGVVDDIGLSYNGTTSWRTGTIGILGDHKCIYAFWDKNPEGDAWVVGDLAGLLAGVRVDAGNTGRCYGLVVHLVGSGGRRPTNDLGACPAVSHVRQGVAIGSANVMQF
jgi:hypothetical protein